MCARCVASPPPRKPRLLTDGKRPFNSAGAAACTSSPSRATCGWKWRSGTSTGAATQISAQSSQDRTAAACSPRNGSPTMGRRRAVGPARSSGYASRPMSPPRRLRAQHHDHHRPLRRRYRLGLPHQLPALSRGDLAPAIATPATKSPSCFGRPDIAGDVCFLPLARRVRAWRPPAWPAASRRLRSTTPPAKKPACLASRRKAKLPGPSATTRLASRRGGFIFQIYQGVLKIDGVTRWSQREGGYANPFALDAATRIVVQLPR